MFLILCYILYYLFFTINSIKNTTELGDSKLSVNFDDLEKHNILDVRDDYDKDYGLKNISFHLYTRSNPDEPYEIIFGNNNTLLSTKYNHSNPTKIIIHGYLENYLSHLNELSRKAFFKNYDVNIISVDWSDIAHIPYESAVKIVPSAGIVIAEFIDWLIELGSSIDSFHVIGFSLGAHVAGSSARNVKTGQVNYLTGLDPAGKFWDNSSDCINKKDAKYVEIIHTNSREISMKNILGHADFYPNSGIIMPGCDNDLCSHIIVIEYFAESIENNCFLAKKCVDYKEVLEKNCSYTDMEYMGGVFPKQKLGIFYLETNSQPPYCKRNS